MKGLNVFLGFVNLCSSRLLVNRLVSLCLVTSEIMRVSAHRFWGFYAHSNEVRPMSMDNIFKGHCQRAHGRYRVSYFCMIRSRELREKFILSFVT